MPGTEREPRINEAVCLALYSAMNATLQLYRDLLTPWGLTYQQLMVLGLLWDEATATPGRIAEVLRLDTSSIAGLLRRLETLGLITREPDPADRRRVLVSATERSQEIASQLGWLEDCISTAIGLDQEQAHDLVQRLHGLRDAVAGYQRPDPTDHAVGVGPGTTSR